MAEAQQAQVRAELAIAAQQLARTQIKAPFAGRVAKRLADPGAMLATGTPLFTFVDDATLEFRASVPSADYGKAAAGRHRRRDGGRASAAARVKGTVARISPLVEERTRAFEVTVQVPGRPRARGRPLRPRVGAAGPGDGRSRRAAGGAAARRQRPPGAQAFVVADGKAERKTRDPRRRDRRRHPGQERPQGRRPRGARPPGGAQLRAPRSSSRPRGSRRHVPDAHLDQQPVFATMMMVALAVLGLTSYRQLKVDQFPNVDFPIVTVTTVYAGATPEAVEREVTKKIEESINTVEGIRHVESTSQEGLSSIIVHVPRGGLHPGGVAGHPRQGGDHPRRCCPGRSRSRSSSASTPTRCPSSRCPSTPPASPPRPPPRSRTRPSRSGWRPWPAWAR